MKIPASILLAPRTLQSEIGLALAIAAVYFVVAKLSFLVTIPPGSISPVFPAAGLALAVVWAWGRPALFGVWLGSFVANTISFCHGSLSPSAILTAIIVGSLVGLGAMSGAALGAAAVRRFRPKDSPLSSSRGVLILVFVGALCGCLVSPTCGVTSLALGGYLPWSQFGYSWLTWWAGDAIGAVIAAPLVLAWLLPQTEIPSSRRWEIGLFIVVAAVFCYLTFFRSLPFAYGVLLLLLWSAFRFGMRGVTSASIFITVAAAIGTSHGLSDFSRGSVNESLLFLQSFLGITTICGLFLAAVLNERHQITEQLRQHHDQLETLVALRTKEALEAQRQAEAANRAKSTFLANMSHEIRTPMNVVLGYAQILQQDERLAPDQKNSIAAILHGGEHLLNLINNILDLSKIEAGKTSLQLQPRMLQDLFADAECLFTETLAAKQLRLNFTIAPGLPRVIVADTPKISQILLNLISNAAKFTEQGGVDIHLSGHAGDQADQWTFAISVSDTGCGIPESELDHVFNAFEQTTAGIRVGGGSGLGLAISKNFARLMGGDIRFTSQVGIGSSFIFSFQAQVTEIEKISPPPRDATSWGRLAPDQGEIRLLIVDDAVDNRNVARSLTEALGFTVREVQNGQEALEITAQWQPQIILMDIFMPVMNGIDCARILRQQPENQKTCIIALSAAILENDHQQLAAAGFDAILAKPFLIQDLLASIAQHSSCRFTTPKRHAKVPVGPVDKTHLTRLPEEIQSRLSQALLICDVSALAGLIPDIQEHNPALAAHILEAVDSFDLTLLQHILPNER